MTLKISKYTYGGRTCFELPEGRYYLMSRHRTRGNAQVAQKKLDFPNRTLIRKYGKSWLLLGVQTVRR